MINECKICGHETEEFHHEKFEMIFHQCNNCELIWKDSSVHVSREDEFKVYENHNNSIHDERYVKYFKDFIHDSIVPFAGDGKEGLDFGSGPEPVLSMILERDYGYTMDIYDKFYATRKAYIGNRYDLITSTEVVEHMDDSLEYFRLFRNLLRDEGIIAIMTLFHPVKRQEFLDWFYIRDPSHISFFTPRTMEIIADKVGLEFIFTDNHRYSTLKIK